MNLSAAIHIKIRNIIDVLVEAVDDDKTGQLIERSLVFEMCQYV